MHKLPGIQGCGIGLRREFLLELESPAFRPTWVEIAPENWISMPYRYRAAFAAAMERFPVVAHGLSLSIGSPEPLNRKFISGLKSFLDDYAIEHYSEHLSFSTYYGAMTYELLPVPMTKAMAEFISDKLKEASDLLNRPVIMENATYYYAPYAEMAEVDFINLVLEKSGMPMLLDVNNVYVNSMNHGFDPDVFIGRLDLERVAYIHVAGHTFFPEDNIIIDTHGAPVVDNVWELLSRTLKKAPAPVLLERDNNIPSFSAMVSEYERLKSAADPYLGQEAASD